MVEEATQGWIKQTVYDLLLCTGEPMAHLLAILGIIIAAVMALFAMPQCRAHVLSNPNHVLHSLFRWLSLFCFGRLIDVDEEFPVPTKEQLTTRSGADPAQGKSVLFQYTGELGFTDSRPARYYFVDFQTIRDSLPETSANKFYLAAVLLISLAVIAGFMFFSSVGSGNGEMAALYALMLVLLFYIGHSCFQIFMSMVSISNALYFEAIITDKYFSFTYGSRIYLYPATDEILFSVEEDFIQTIFYISRNGKMNGVIKMPNFYYNKVKEDFNLKRISSDLNALVQQRGTTLNDIR